MEQSSEATIESWADVGIPEFSESDSPEAEAEAPVDTDAATESDVSPATADDDTADQPETETADEGTEPGAASPEDQPTAAEAQHTAEPFTFRVDGSEVEVPGATRTGDAITIPADAWNRVVQPRLADRSAWQRERQGFQRQIAELTERADPEKNPDVVRARELGRALDALMELPEEQIYDRIVELRQQWPILRERAEKEALKRQLETRETEATTAETERLVEEWTPKLQAGLRQGVAQVLGSDEYRGLGIDAEKVATTLWDDPALRRAAFGVAQDGDGTGLPPGTPYVNLEFLDRYIRPAASWALQRIEAVKKVDQAKRRNQERLGGGGVVSATVGVRGAPAAGGKAAAEPKSYEEWAESLKNIGL